MTSANRFLLPAPKLRQALNSHGAQARPCLFGVDFEMQEAFFVPDPLEQSDILFAVNQQTNAVSASMSPLPDTPIAAASTDFAAYLHKFNKAQHGLLRGDSFLLNLTERTPVVCKLSLDTIFHCSQAPYKLLFPQRFVCFSPEPFVRIRDSRIATYPMKGTVDCRVPEAERKLMENYKEQCEHNTIVDLMRNDLGIVARDVQVRRFRFIEKIATSHGEILQTSSEIVGTLSDGWRAEVGDLLFELLPAGSISGAPKQATVRLIQEAEQETRGFYTGVFGYFDGKALDSAVMIRFIEQDGDTFYFRSGGGITAHSRAEEEYNEILEKIYVPIPRRHAR